MSKSGFRDRNRKFDRADSRQTASDRRRQSSQSVPMQNNVPPAAPAHRLVCHDETELLPFLLTSLAPMKPSHIKDLLKHRCIAVNGERMTHVSTPLHDGDTVEIKSSKQARFGLNHPLLHILYEDDYIMAVYKESGLLSVDMTGHRGENATTILDKYIQKTNASKRIFIVHRLDRDTSGVMLFAKCREAQQKLIADWNERILERTYIAVAEGVFHNTSGTVDTYLYEDDRMVMHSTDDPTMGVRAVTHYKVLKTNGRYTLLQLELETGRTNQIRVHMQSLGHSLVGDDKYGASEDPIQRLGLHARTIKFYHPISQKIMKFEIPEPQCFDACVQSS